MSELPLALWVASREPAPPVGLETRLARLFAAHPAWEALPRPEAFLAASATLLEQVQRAPHADRGVALDLLAADACVTYAFEAAADTPERLDALAASAMRSICGLS